MPTTGFKPAVDGFDFGNFFYDTSGRCGGMAYAALDYFLTPGRHTPHMRPQPGNGSYVPSDDIPLPKYLMDRQLESLVWATARVTAITLFGLTDSLRFRSGTVGDEFKNLKEWIARGPCQLGLVSVDVGVVGVHHQVLAIGYTGGTTETNLRVQVYDPNLRNQTDTLVPDAGNNCFRTELTTKRWRTYFVDTAYYRKDPPNYQNGWGLCLKCLAIAHGQIFPGGLPTQAGQSGFVGAGKCPADGGLHQILGSKAILRDTTGTAGEAGWRKCTKCSSLHKSLTGACPAGGTHTSGDTDYVLFYPHQAPNDCRFWFRCKKCGCLVNPTPRPCAAGGVHDADSVREYSLPW